MYSYRTMELLTTMPTSIIAPMPDIMEIVFPVRYKASTIPGSINGTLSATENGCKYDSNCEAKSIYIRMNDNINVNANCLREFIVS